MIKLIRKLILKNIESLIILTYRRQLILIFQLMEGLGIKTKA